MARVGKLLFVWCCAAALLAVAYAADAADTADAEDSTLTKVLNAPRRILRGYAHAWSNRGYYGGYGGWGWGWPAFGMMMPYQENRWVSASRMDLSTERRFNMVSK